MYEQLWEALEKSKPIPTRFRTLHTLNWSEFQSGVLNGNAHDMVENLYAGDSYLIKGAFTEKFMLDLRRNVHEYCKTHPSEFHKMLEGTPDFHRIIDIETGKNYSFNSCKHSCYFYHWNEDPFDIFDTINDRWHILKILMGLRYNEYENNTPKDGVIDRIQVVRYPPKFGYLEPHFDAHQHQRLIFNAYMSKRGIDYQGGGFYLINSKNEAVNIEDLIDVGDMCFGYASVYHGVAPVDADKECDWTKDDGRWFLSMYSNASDEMKDRFTASPVKLDIPGVLPKV